MIIPLTSDKIQSYLENIKKNSSLDEFNDKVKSIQRFCIWAIEKGHLGLEEFNQIQQVIANLTLKPVSQNTPLYTENTTNVDTEPYNSEDDSEASNQQTRIFTGLPFRSYVFGAFFTIALILIFVPRFLNNTTKKKIVSADKGKVMLFKGVLADSLGNAVTKKTDVVFRIYSTEIGGTPIYTGACTGMNAITPDIKGNIKVNLGKDCEMKAIPNSLFEDSTLLYLGITPSTDPEMLPRKQIANVGFSADSQKLQGLATGNSLSSIPFINEEGDLLIEAPQASIKSTLKSAAFTLSSAGALNVQSENEDLILKTLKSGAIKFKTNAASQDKDSLIIAENGNIGINGADPTLFAVQVAGDIGPNFTDVYSLGSFTNQWNTIYGKTIYQNGNEVCDSSNNCSGTSSLSNLTAPKSALKLAMGSFNTELAYGATTGTLDLFKLTDSVNNTGTGYLMNLSTQSGSNLNVLSMVAAGRNALAVLKDGSVAIGTTEQAGKLQVRETGITSRASYAGLFENTSDNRETDGINKYGLYVASTGDFLGKTGTATNNYGMYIKTTTGGDNNYDIYAASGAYLSTGGDWHNASSVTLKENFVPVNPEDILSKINQLDLSTWNYKTESDNIRHLGPTAEQFYDIFTLGDSNKNISTIDPSGIALAGIKALDKKISDVQNNQRELMITNQGDAVIEQNADSLVYTYNGILDQKKALENETFTVRMLNGTIVKDVRAFGTVVTSSINAGLVKAKTIVVDGSLYAAHLATNEIESVSAHIDSITTSSINANQKITSPLIDAGSINAADEAKLNKIKTNQIAALNDNVTINLNTSSSSEAPVQPGDKGVMAKLIIKGLEDKVVTTIDGSGNIVTDGNITSGTATVSGSLTASSVQTTSLQSDTVSANTASISGELVADNIKSRALDDINNKITSTTSSIGSITNQVNDVQTLLAKINSSTLPSVQNYTQPSTIPVGGNPAQSITTQATYDSINILSQANMYKAVLSESLIIGSLVLKNNNLLSLESDFNIASLNTISFFDRSFTIAKDGAITAKGPINALAGIKTDTIKPIEGNSDINIILGKDQENTSPNSTSQFKVNDSNNSTVASINSNGEASFKAVSLDKYMAGTSSAALIAADDNLSQNGIYSPALDTQSQSAGVGLIPLNNTQVLIYNDSIKANSLIYLTPTGEIQDNNLTVVEKESCAGVSGFCRPYFRVVSAKASASSPINFNWLVIN